MKMRWSGNFQTYSQSLNIEDEKIFKAAIKAAKAARKYKLAPIEGYIYQHKDRVFFAGLKRGVMTGNSFDTVWEIDLQAKRKEK
ncbi:MAG: hypothetical protein GY861_27005 [bacterium]|nr:hypothetical protein [bacterium]